MKNDRLFARTSALSRAYTRLSENKLIFKGSRKLVHNVLHTVLCVSYGRRNHSEIVVKILSAWNHMVDLPKFWNEKIEWDEDEERDCVWEKEREKDANCEQTENNLKHQFKSIQNEPVKVIAKPNQTKLTIEANNIFKFIVNKVAVYFAHCIHIPDRLCTGTIYNTHAHIDICIYFGMLFGNQHHFAKILCD